MSRKTLILVLVALVPVAIGIGGYLVETDAEAIARVADECRMAFLAGDAERVLVASLRTTKQRLVARLRTHTHMFIVTHAALHGQSGLLQRKRCAAVA